MKLKELIREYVVKKITMLITAEINQADYHEKANLMLRHKFYAYEVALMEASADRDDTALVATALEAKADLIDCVREFLGHNLLPEDMLPARPTAYEIQDWKGKPVLVKVSSLDIPRLNYPLRGLYTGETMRHIKKELKDVQTA